MLRLRQHASLLVWLNGSDNPPPADVEQAYLKVEAETHWPNPILSSATADAHYRDRRKRREDDRALRLRCAQLLVRRTQHYGGAFGFNTETSPGPAIPSLASREKFLPDPEAWPPSATWSLHYGGGEFANLKVFDEAMEAVYAKPNSAADYERMAQTMEYDSERAMFEAYSKKQIRLDRRHPVDAEQRVAFDDLAPLRLLPRCRCADISQPRRPASRCTFSIPTTIGPSWW